MADDVQDIAIYTGSEWTSLSELAAGVVDAKLPIESVDGTVKLDGASSVFTVSTGGEERVKVDGSGHVAVNRTPRANTQFEVTSDAASPFTLILDGTASTEYEGRSGLRMYGTGTFISEFYTNAEEGTYGFSGGFTSRSGILTGDLYADILVKPGQAVVMQYSIQTPSVRGLADNDAEVTLGSSFTVSTGGEERLKVTDKGYVGFNCDPTYNFQVQGVNNSGNVTTDSMRYSGGILYCQNTADATVGFYFQTNTSGGTATRSVWGLTTQYPSVGKDSNLELRNTGFSVAGGPSPPIFSFTTEKNFIVHDGQIQTPSVRGLAENDASVTLDGKATVSAAPRLCETVWDSANNEISELFGSKNIKCYAPNGRVNYVRPNDTQTGYFYWYDVNLEPDQKSIASVGAGGFTLSATETLGFTGDGINFAANSKGDQATVLWAMKQDGGLIGGGETAYIQTPSVRGLADNDAEVLLGSDLTLNNNSGIIWLGSSTNAPAGTTSLFVGASDGDGKNLLISSGQPKTAAEAGSGISFATVAGNGDRARKTRMFIDSEGNVGIDDVNLDERLCVAGSIKAKRLKGYNANPQLIFESQQASIQAGDGSEYVPTDSASIATKKIVDDKIWVGSTAQYLAIPPRDILPTTLYCLTD